MKRALVILAVVVVLGGAYYLWNRVQEASGPKPIATALFVCDGRSSIAAAFFDDHVELGLSDTRTLTLPHAVSADGARYANADESFVFWNKGRGAFIEENKKQTYANCIEVAQDPGTLPQIYADGVKGFSIRFPAGYTVDSSYAYDNLGPEEPTISGVKFHILASTATGTNLSGFDTGISVEQMPQMPACRAEPFLISPSSVADETIGGVEYSVASSSDAAAGNRYEEWVYAVKGTSPCIAIRYFIHYSAIENYPDGTVQAFDRAALTKAFDAVRASLIIR